MKEFAKAMGMYAATWFVGVVAARYHLNGEQTAAVMADVVGAAAMVAGATMHYIAWKTDPNKIKP